MRHRYPIASLGLVAALALLLSPGPARAFVTSGTTWGGGTTTMSLNVGTPWNTEAEDALFRWNDVPAHGFHYTFNNDDNDHCQRGTACLFTGGNAVEWDNFSNGVCENPASGALAVARTNWVFDYCNADVLFNNQFSWTDADRGCTTTSPFNFSSVAMHEFGHALGLNHEDDELALMNSIYHNTHRVIHGDDRAGVRAAYSGSGTINDIALSHWKKTSSSSSASAVVVTAPPGTVNVSTNFTFQYVQENWGNVTANFNTGFYLSTNDFISTADTFLGSNSGASQSVGNSLVVNRTLSLPKDTPTGTYWIGAIADYDGAIAEDIESNNDFEPCQSTFVDGGPDLDITAWNAVQEPGVPGVALDVTYTILNSGGDASGSRRLGVYLSTNTTCTTSDTLLGTRTIPSLGRNATSSGTINVTVPGGYSLGTRYMCGIIDDQFTLTELDETNNTAYDLIQIVECTTSSQCSDGVFCNGSESCVSNSCQAGSFPCNDGISCTTDSCVEALSTCLFFPNSGLCQDGVFCNGSEVCTAGVGCQAGTPPTCDDGVGCTIDFCDAGPDACANNPNDAACQDGAFCNGAEVCDPVADCLGGPAPCAPGDICDEGIDQCLLDRDADGLPDIADNCPDWPNPAQADVDLNGLGDDCECGDQGSAAGSGPGFQDGKVNLSDIFAINAAIFDPGLVTDLCDTNFDASCNLLDLTGANDRIFGDPAHCVRNPPTGCAIGVLGENFGPDMSGCAGSATFDLREDACAPGWSACKAAEWVAGRAGGIPTYNYWTDDLLRYNGTFGSCWVDETLGTDCGALTPMRVCASSSPDALGNFCNWTNCGYPSTPTPNEYFGGCAGNTTAGTLCCRD